MKEKTKRFTRKKKQEKKIKKSKAEKNYPLNDTESDDTDVLTKAPDVWSVISPEGVGITKKTEDYGVIKQTLGTKTFFRPFYITREGYPRKLQTNWMSGILNQGEVDVMIDIQKTPKTNAVRSLQKQNTILRSSLMYQSKRGNRDVISDLEMKIVDNEHLMEEIQFQENDLYDVSVTGNLFAENEIALNRSSDKLEDSLSYQFIRIASAWGRVKKGLRTVSILGRNEIPESTRNIDRRALATFSPFISGSGRFNGGIPIGNNLITGQKEFLNAFGTPSYRPNNYNMAIFGVAGSGKSVTLKLLLSRESSGMGIYSRLIDVEGEFVDIVRKLGGINITLYEESLIRINPLAIQVSTIPFDEEDEELELLQNGVDDREIIEKDGEMYVRFVPIREKINEVIDFFDILVQGKEQGINGLDVFERNILEQTMKYLYTQDPRFLYTSHPDSLFIYEAREVNGVINQLKVKKDEPTLTDVFNYIEKEYESDSHSLRLLAALRPFLRDGSKPIFDGQTYFGKGVDINIHTARLVNFNISKMEEGFLRPLAYHVILNYIWEYFSKNIENAYKKKVVYCDEFWTLLDNTQTVKFAEKMARRCRKRNTSFRIASQDFVKIVDNPTARGVLQNTETFFFMKQNKIDLKRVQENFDLSNGELSILFNNPEIGEGILRVGKSSVRLKTDPSAEELEFIESNAAIARERRLQKK
ncbi:VirB4 family type IV secretion system protein [Kurthia gibsonii]|uniref:VirB4 family type IV secretion system protein n=1 Tax=Kurthia gibsonii TaxID=33946 RepID=UPI002DB82157|nr:DUF87 domain-containing protein [Kurthia gibsonii]MEB7773549.1 DUF87 domain-containing protein [Kurthia gibsonii]